MKEVHIKEKYVQVIGNSLAINKSTLELTHDVLENVQIDSHDGALYIVGEIWDVRFTHEKLFLEDYPEIDMRVKVDYGYKNLIDFFRGVKRPYVIGYYKMKKNIPYSARKSNWNIKTYEE